MDIRRKAQYCRRFGYLQSMRTFFNTQHPRSWLSFGQGIAHARLPTSSAFKGAAVGVLMTTMALLTSPVKAQTPKRFTDDMAERTRACTACHGDQGRAGPDGYYPRLAGKPAAYLHNQLRNFAQGRRHYELMARLVDPLTDAYMGEMAQYFADLKLPYPAPTANNAITPERLTKGQQLVTQGDASRGLPACTQCHGVRLTGVQPHVPGLLGLPIDYLNAQLGAWQTRQRRAHAPDCMAEIVQRMPTDDLIAVTSWLARQPVPADSRPADRPTAGPALPESLRCGSAPELSATRPPQAGGRP
jgi:cytochrome c553